MGCRHVYLPADFAALQGHMCQPSTFCQLLGTVPMLPNLSVDVKIFVRTCGYGFMTFLQRWLRKKGLNDYVFEISKIDIVAGSAI